MKLTITFCAKDAKTGTSYLTFNNQFTVVRARGKPGLPAGAVVVIGEQHVLSELLMDPSVKSLPYEPSSDEVSEAKNMVLYSYNAYIDNLGVLI